MKKRITPYNTGKVLIGKDYVPAPDKGLTEPSADMYHLQSKLLGSPMPTTLETWVFRVVAVVVLVAVAADMIVWRPN